MSETKSDAISETLLRTPLFEEHLLSNAKMVAFAGWEMPVQYQGVREEHDNVRKNVGLFDVSHMGEIRFQGPKALETLEWLTTNEVKKLQAQEAQYSLLPNDTGGLVDDIIIYCLEPNQDYLVCVNAANKDKDFAWMTKNNRGAFISDESNKWAQIAVQGPKALTLIERVLPGLVGDSPKPFTFKQGKWAGVNFICAFTGYTGERGGEIFIEPRGARKLWSALLTEGKDLGVQPIGLGARDTLRTEMKYSLYGHEIDDVTNPYWSGLGWVIKAQIKDFIGKSKMIESKNQGMKLVGLKLRDKGIPRQGYSLFTMEGQEMGKITSGTFSPTLNESIGIGFVLPDNSKPGQELFVDIRGRKTRAVVVTTPFVKTELT